MADFPEQGLTPWRLPLKAYLDEREGVVQDAAVSTAVATAASDATNKANAAQTAAVASATATAASDATAKANAAQAAALAASAPRTSEGLPLYAGDRVNPYDAMRNVYNWKPSNTRKLRAALGRARAGTGVANFPFIGDSATEGQTGPAGAMARTKAWPVEMRATLASLGIPAAGDGMVLGGSSVAPFDTRVTFTGSWTQTSGWANGTTSGGTAVWTFMTPNTHFDIWSSGVSGEFTVKIDGGAVVATVSPTGASTWIKTTVSTTAGLHTITITKTNATATGIKAVNAYSTSGVLAHNMAASGWSAADWTTYTLWYQHVGATELLLPKASMDAVFICLGANDIALQAKTPAQAAASLAAVVDRWQPGPDIVLVLEQHANAITQSTWDTFCELVYDLADTENIPLIDIYSRIGTYTQGNANGLYGDTSHLTVAGMADWGRNAAMIAAA